MGKLGIDCLTSTPDSSTFYGLDTTYSYDYTTEYKDGTSFIIFKSNTNPTSPENLTWSLVSRIYIEDLGFTSPGDYTCAVDAHGAFTFFFRDWQQPNLPRGVLYDPNGIVDSHAIAGSKGPGTWRTIDGSMSYQWEGSYPANQALQYVDSPSGPLLLLCSISGYSVQFASYSKEANALHYIGSWFLQSEYTVSPMVFTMSHDHLYVLFRTPMSFGTLYSYPLSSMGNNTLPVYKNYTSPATRSCGDSPSPRLFTSQKALYLLCDQQQFSTVPFELYTIKDPDTDTSLGTAESLSSDVTIPYGQSFSTLGGGAGEAHFLLFNSFERNHALPLDGPSRAVINTTDIIIDDTSGIDIDNIISPDRSFNLEVVGSIAAVVLFGFLAIFLYRRRRRQLSAQRGSQSAAGPVTDTTHTTDIDSEPTAPTGSIHHQQQQPEMSTPVGQSLPTVTLSYPPPSTPTTVLPMAPISTRLQHQSVQDQMQALQLSQHPHATVENAQPSDINTIITAPDSSPWQPTPFVPPQRIRSPEQGDSTLLSMPSTASPPLVPRSSRPRHEIDITRTPPPIHNPHA